MSCGRGRRYIFHDAMLVVVVSVQVLYEVDNTVMMVLDFVLDLMANNHHQHTTANTVQHSTCSTRTMYVEDCLNFETCGIDL